MPRLRTGYRQFVLQAAGGHELVCWLKDDPRLTVGRRLTLRADRRVWAVSTRYETLTTTPPETHWRVGGLR